MSNINITTSRPGDRELLLTATIDAPPAKLYAAWTQPDLMTRWFAPKPWETPRVTADVRPGGSCNITMRGPDGTEFDNPGIYLELVPNERIVTTDAYTEAWVPSQKPYMTLILTFEDLGGKTKYTARLLHWTKEDCDSHEKMGFHEGWPICTQQLADLVTAK